MLGFDCFPQASLFLEWKELDVKNNVEIFKNGGFYSVYNNDTYIFYYLFGYKIIDNLVGFSLSAYNKVINKLVKLKIDYENKSLDVCKKFKKLNKYNYFLEKERTKYSLEYRLNKVLLLIEKLDEKEIDEIISYIGRKLNINE